jgi:signal transduction histidine kinase
LLSHRLVEIQEGERRAIARELHDQTGQALTMLRILLDRAKIEAGKTAYPILNEARAVLLETVDQVREMSLNLRPSMLDDLGLIPTLLWYFDRYTTRTKIRVNFKHTGLSKTLPLEVRIATYRIVQEALSNVARHARTDEVAVSISLIRKRLHLRIEDSGTGFDPAVIMPTSAGISGMEERVHLLGGRIQVDSTPGMGTRLTAEIPLTK